MVKITHAIVKIITGLSDEGPDGGSEETIKSVHFPLYYTNEEIRRFLTEKQCTGCYFVDGYDPESGSVIPVVGFSPYHKTVSVGEIVDAVDAVRDHCCSQLFMIYLKVESTLSYYCGEYKYTFYGRCKDEETFIQCKRLLEKHQEPWGDFTYPGNLKMAGVEMDDEEELRIHEHHTKRYGGLSFVSNYVTIISENEYINPDRES